VRVIAATNKDLTQAIAAKSFREDLYYRLSVFPIHIPPLRERREDILPLAELFARGIAVRMGKPVPSLAQEASEFLQKHDWPGNVRELANAIERALIVSQSAVIEKDDLPMKGEPSMDSRPGLLAQVEKKTIMESLARNGGDRRATSEELGISLRTLQYRLKEFAIAGKD